METEAYLEHVNGADICGGRPGEGEERLRQLFDKALNISEDGPCVLFIDEIDALCPQKGIFITLHNEMYFSDKKTTVYKHRNWVKIVTSYCYLSNVYDIIILFWSMNIRTIFYWNYILFHRNSNCMSHTNESSLSHSCLYRQQQLSTLVSA